MASTVDNPIPSPSKIGQSADPERGRKRRRSSANLPPASHSANLRGRARRRSVSSATAQGAPEKKGRVNIHAAKSPSRKFLKRSTELDILRKRSQSPSRSRCAGDKQKDSPPRRRQRTTSRSRKHDEGSGNEIEDGSANNELKEDGSDDVTAED